MNSILRIAVLTTLAISQNAFADTSVFVDSYQTNITANTTTSTNAALYLLQGYSSLWSTGASWNTGAPTAAGLAVMQANEAYVVNATNNRTSALATEAYLADRRNQSYSAINGLGSLASAYKTAAGATTTITSVAADATTAKYDDKGTGSGNTSSASVGNIVQLVNTLRGNYSSTTPAKNYFSSPRPWRLNDNGVVVSTGTETTGYYTSTLADGTPNQATSLTYFPSYQTNVSVLPTLMAARSTTPASDGGFASGHTNAVYLAGFAMGYAMPTSFQSMLLNASQVGEDRIIAGMHSPLDVIGGRMLATALSAGILSDSANASLKAAAVSQGQAFVTANTNVTTTNRFNDYAVDTSSTDKANKALYTSRMTYGLPNTNSTTVAAVVPKGAEVLLETRQAYLDAGQRREVLRTTAIASGNVLTDDAEGWGRLNYYAAADGYGRFDSNVSVTMDASKGGFSAKDAWRNDISGSGGLTKDGSGQLALTGNNTFTGDVVVKGGTLVAESANAFGSGNLVNAGGTIAINHRGTVTISGNFTESVSSLLELDVASDANYDILSIIGSSSFDGDLNVVLQDSSKIGLFKLIGSNQYSGAFKHFSISGLSNGYNASLIYTADGVSVNIAAVPEPQSYAMLLLGLGIMGVVVRRKSNI